LDATPAAPSRPLKNRETLWLLLLGLGILFSIGIDSEALYPDASRHAMDGAFYLDLLSGQVPLAHFPDGIWQYEAHHPAIKPHEYPPVFALVEALCFAVFGISFWAARLAVILFAALALFFTLRLITRSHGENWGFLAAALLLLSPSFFRWGREVMLEVPALAMTLGAVYFYLKSMTPTKEEAAHPASRRWSFIAFLFFALLVPYTKQTAGCVYPVLVIGVTLFLPRSAWLSRRNLIGAAILVLGLLPLAYITLKYGQHLLQQTSGDAMIDPAAKPDWWDWSHLAAWTYYPTHWPQMAGWPVLALAPLSLFSTWSGLRGRLKLFFLLWLLTVYVLFSIMAYKNERHGITMILPLIFLAIEGLTWLANCCGNRPRLVLGLWLMPILLQAGLGDKQFSYLSGAREAVETVREKKDEGCLFIQGYTNGNLVFWMRALGPCWETPTLQATRLLGHQRIMKIFGEKDYVRSREEILELLRRYRCRYLIVESQDLLDGSPFKLLLNTLNAPDASFVLEKVIPILCVNPLPGEPNFNEVSYLIYRFTEPLVGHPDKLQYPLWDDTIKTVPFHPDYTRGQAK